MLGRDHGRSTGLPRETVRIYPIRSRGPGTDSTLRRAAPRGKPLRQVVALLEQNRSKLDSLAAALLEHETLDEEDAYAAAGVPRNTAPRADSYTAAARSRIRRLDDSPPTTNTRNPSATSWREKRAERCSTTPRRRTRGCSRGSKRGVPAERGEQWLLHGSEVPPPFSKVEVLESVDRPLIEENGGILVSTPDGEISPRRPGGSAMAR